MSHVISYFVSLSANLSNAASYELLSFAVRLTLKRIIVGFCEDHLWADDLVRWIHRIRGLGCCFFRV